MKIKILSTLILGAFPIVCQAAAAAGAGEESPLANHFRGRVEKNADLQKMGDKAITEPMARKIIENDLKQGEDFANQLGVSLIGLKEKIAMLQGEMNTAVAASAGAAVLPLEGISAAASAAPSSIQKQIDGLVQIVGVFKKKLGRCDFQKIFLEPFLVEPVAAGAAAAAAPHDFRDDIKSTLTTRGGLAKPSAGIYAEKMAAASLSEEALGEITGYVTKKVEKYTRMLGLVKAMIKKSANCFVPSTDSFKPVIRSKAFRETLLATYEASIAEFRETVSKALLDIYEVEGAAAATRVANLLKRNSPPADIDKRIVGTFALVPNGAGGVGCDQVQACMRLNEAANLIKGVIAFERGEGPGAGAKLSTLEPAVAAMTNTVRDVFMAALDSIGTDPVVLEAASLEYRLTPEAAIASILAKWNARLADLRAREYA